MNKENEGMMAKRLVNWANKYFTRILRQQEVEAYGEQAVIQRAHRFVAIKDGLARVERLDAELEEMVKALPVRPTEEAALSAGDEAIAQYEMAVKTYDECVLACQAKQDELKSAAIAYANLEIVGMDWAQDKTTGVWRCYDIPKQMPKSHIAEQTIMEYVADKAKHEAGYAAAAL